MKKNIMKEFKGASIMSDKSHLKFEQALGDIQKLLNTEIRL